MLARIYLYCKMMVFNPFKLEISFYNPYNPFKGKKPVTNDTLPTSQNL